MNSIKSEKILSICSFIFYLGYLISFYAGLVPSINYVDLLVLGFDKYGYWLVLFLSVGENIPIVNSWFPGSIPLAFGLVVLDLGGYSLLFYILTAAIGTVVTNIFVFMILRIVQYEKAVKDRQSIYLAEYMLSPVHPHMISVVTLKLVFQNVSSSKVRVYYLYVFMCYILGGFALASFNFTIDGDSRFFDILFLVYLSCWVYTSIRKK